jgi:hypothetical protein
LEPNHKASGTLLFDKSGTGCNQGGEGSVEFSEWWVENVFEELDAESEWFYNKSTKTLYYFHNATAGTPPPADTNFVATKTKVSQRLCTL